MASDIYWVKREKPLFRKGDWTVKLNNLVIGLYKDRDSAVAEAITEAERTSILGRKTEVWVDDGDGFLLAKAFMPAKPSKGAGDDDEDSPGDQAADDAGLY